jgi:hypothetical protein
MDTEAVSLRLPACKDILRASGLPVQEGAPLLLIPSAVLDDRRWRDDPIDEGEVRPLGGNLMAACFVVIAYLSGMCPGEVLALERGCLTRDPASGLLLVTSRHWKGVRTRAAGRLRCKQTTREETPAGRSKVLRSLQRRLDLHPHCCRGALSHPPTGDVWVWCRSSRRTSSW